MNSTQKKPNDLLRLQRDLRGWSQRRVADEVGTSADIVSRWERGERKPEPYYREKLCVLFGKNAEELGFLDTSQSLYHTGGTNLSRRSPNIDTQRNKWGIKRTMTDNDKIQDPFVFEEECFSFGKIKTTGIVLDGDGVGTYLPQHIRSRYIPVAEELPKSLQARTMQIQQEQERKKEQGLPFFWNGEIYSIDRFAIGREPINESMTLDLWFRPSDYYTFRATNLSLDDPSLRQKYLKDVDWYETIPYFSHSFGTSLVVITSDGYTLLAQRSPRQGSNAGYYSISANEGLSRPIDRGASSEAPDLYRCAVRGLAEELGLHEPADFSVSDITFLSFEVDTQYALWGILGMVKVQRTVAHILESWHKGVKDKMENKKLFPVPFTPQDVCSFVFSHEHWTPGGLICLYHALAHEFGRAEVDRVVASY